MNDIFVSGGTEDWCWILKIFFQVVFLSQKNTFMKKKYWRVWGKKSRGVIRKDDKKSFFQKKDFFGKILSVKFFWSTLLSVGVERTNVREENLYFRGCFSLKIFFPKKNLWKIWFIISKGYTRMTIVVKNGIFSMKTFFQEMFSWMTLLSVGVQRSADRTEKFYFSDFSFLKNYLFLKKKLWKFCYILSIGYTRMMIVFKI